MSFEFMIDISRVDWRIQPNGSIFIINYPTKFDPVGEFKCTKCDTVYPSWFKDKDAFDYFLEHCVCQACQELYGRELVDKEGQRKLHSSS